MYYDKLDTDIKRYSKNSKHLSDQDLDTAYDRIS